MEKINNCDNITEAGKSAPLKPGIYGLRIIKVENDPSRECLSVWVDFVKGEYEGYYSRIGADAGKQYRSYKEKALPFFKAFITSVEKSNPGYVWDWDENKLVGKNVIGVFGEEEYVNKEGKVDIVVKCQEFRSLEAFKNGDIKVPAIKKLTEEQIQERLNQLGLTAPSVVEEVSVDDLPF